MSTTGLRTVLSRSHVHCVRWLSEFCRGDIAYLLMLASCWSCMILAVCIDSATHLRQTVSDNRIETRVGSGVEGGGWCSGRSVCRGQPPERVISVHAFPFARVRTSTAAKP